MLSRAVKDLKISVDKFTTQIPTLEDKVKYLENKVVDRLNEVRAQEFCLERTTRANEDYKKQNAQLTKKLESKSFPRIKNILSFSNHFLSDPAPTHRVRCRAHCPKDDGGQCSGLLLPRQILLRSAHPPDARQSADKVLGDYSHQYEVVNESNSRDFEVPIPPGQLGHCGRGLHSDL
jgi:hypothetical protein